MPTRQTVLDEIVMFEPTEKLRDAVANYRAANKALGEARERQEDARRRNAPRDDLTALYQERHAASSATIRAWRALDAQRSAWADVYMEARGVTRGTARSRAKAKSEVMMYGSAERAERVRAAH